MSKRYIDADKVMAEIERIGGHNLCEWETIGVKALIDRQPTADVVEVVRCKDCKYHREWIKGKHQCIRGIPFEITADSFCSYGERREENEG